MIKIIQIKPNGEVSEGTDISFGEALIKKEPEYEKLYCHYKMVIVNHLSEHVKWTDEYLHKMAIKHCVKKFFKSPRMVRLDPAKG